jgi:hypothetical protein
MKEIFAILLGAQGTGFIDNSSKSIFFLDRIFINKTEAATSPQFARNSEVIPLTEAQKLGIVRAHNIYRNAVVPKAANMNALLWSEQLSFRN